MQDQIIAAYNKNASIPFREFDADWASRDYGTGRVLLFKNREFVAEITLKPSQTLVAFPVCNP